MILHQKQVSKFNKERKSIESNGSQNNQNILRNSSKKSFNFIKVLKKNKKIIPSIIKTKPTFYLNKNEANKIDNEDLVNHVIDLLNNSKRTLHEISLLKNFFRSLPIFADLINKSNVNFDGLLESIINCLKHENHEKNKILFKYGETGEKYYIILKGKVKVVIPVQIKRKMKISEYSKYLNRLKMMGEIELVNKCLEINSFAKIPSFLLVMKNQESKKDNDTKFKKFLSKQKSKFRDNKTKSIKLLDDNTDSEESESSSKSNLATKKSERLNSKIEKISKENKISYFLLGNNEVENNKNLNINFNQESFNNRDINNKRSNLSNIDTLNQQKRKNFQSYSIVKNLFARKLNQIKQNINLNTNETDSNVNEKIDIKNAEKDDVLNTKNLKILNANFNKNANNHNNEEFNDNEYDKKFKFNKDSTKLFLKINDINNSKIVIKDEKDTIKEGSEKSLFKSKDLKKLNKKIIKNDESLNQSCINNMSPEEYIELIKLVQYKDYFYLNDSKFSSVNDYEIESDEDSLDYINKDNKDLHKGKNNQIFTIYELIVVSELVPGMRFGELALQSDVNKRAATIIISENADLGILTKINFQRLLKDLTTREINDTSNILTNTFVFNVKFDLKKSLVPSIRKRSYFKNEYIIRNNEKSNLVYFLINGEVSLNLNLNLLELFRLINILKNQFNERLKTDFHECPLKIKEFYKLSSLDEPYIKKIVNNVNKNFDIEILDLNTNEIILLPEMLLSSSYKSEMDYNLKDEKNTFLENDTSIFDIKVQSENAFLFCIDKLNLIRFISERKEIESRIKQQYFLKRELYIRLLENKFKLKFKEFDKIYNSSLMDDKLNMIKFLKTNSNLNFNLTTMTNKSNSIKKQNDTIKVGEKIKSSFILDYKKKNMLNESPSNNNITYTTSFRNDLKNKFTNLNIIEENIGSDLIKNKEENHIKDSENSYLNINNTGKLRKNNSNYNLRLTLKNSKKCKLYSNILETKSKNCFYTQQPINDKLKLEHVDSLKSEGESSIYTEFTFPNKNSIVPISVNVNKNKKSNFFNVSTNSINSELIKNKSINNNHQFYYGNRVSPIEISNKYLMNNDYLVENLCKFKNHQNFIELYGFNYLMNKNTTMRKCKSLNLCIKWGENLINSNENVIETQKIEELNKNVVVNTNKNYSDCKTSKLTHKTKDLNKFAYKTFSMNNIDYNEALFNNEKITYKGSLNEIKELSDKKLLKLLEIKQDIFVNKSNTKMKELNDITYKNLMNLLDNLVENSNCKDFENIIKKYHSIKCGYKDDFFNDNCGFIKKGNEKVREKFIFINSKSKLNHIKNELYLLNSRKFFHSKSKFIK